jgi:hypothetical protein
MHIVKLSPSLWTPANKGHLNKIRCIVQYAFKVLLGRCFRVSTSDCFLPEVKDFLHKNSYVKWALNFYYLNET